LTFLIFVILITALQFLHRRLLHRLLPRGYDHWVAPALLLLHVPLALYMGIRLTGHAAMLPWLRPLARAGIYFQMVTVMDLVLWALATGLWRLGHVKPATREELLEEPGRRKFLRQTTVLGAGLAGTGVLRGRREAYGDPEVVRLDLVFDDLPPGLDGLRILQDPFGDSGLLLHGGEKALHRHIVPALAATAH